MIPRKPLLLLLLIALIAVPANASRVRQANLEELTTRASRIFSGRCVDVRVVQDARLQTRVTLVTFAVDRTLKGQVGSTLVIRMFGATEGSQLGSVPRFAPGEEVVLFLDADSELGLTSPIGMGLGKFSIVRDKSGRRLARNSARNEMLFQGLSPAAAERLTRPVKMWGVRRAIPSDALLDIVEALLAEEDTRP